MASVTVPAGANVVTTGSPYAVILRLAAPTVLAMLTQSLVNKVDIFLFKMLPHPEGSNAQAAMFPSLVLIWMFGGSLSAISVGTQALAARRFAEGKHEEAGGVLVNSWLFALAAGTASTILAYVSLPWVLRFLIDVPEVREEARAYLQWRLPGVASMVMTFSFKSFFDGLGKPHVHMVSALVMNAVNIALCLLLIFGNWGFPRMGIAGAGLAGFAATWVGLGLMIGWSLLGRYRRPYHPFAVSRLERGTIGAILRLSVPSGVATIAVMTGFVLFSKVVSKLDGDVARAGAAGANEAVFSAATTVIVGLLILTFSACLAFGTSTATLVSQSLGEGDPEKAERFGWASVRLGLVVFGTIGFLEGVVFPREILSFLSSSPAVIEAGMIPLRMMGICTPLVATGMILTQALFGAGNTRYVMIVELVLHFTCLIPVAWLLGITLDLGLVGVWSSAAIYMLLLTIAMAWKFARGEWKTIRI